MSKHEGSPRRRGLAVFSFLTVALLAAAAGAVAALAPGPVPPPPTSTRPIDQARVLYLDRDLAGAERLLRELPSDPAAKRLLARVLCDRGRLVESRDLYGTLLSADAKDVDALRGLAQVIRAMGQPGQAVQYLQTAADLRKDDPSVWKELGLAQRDAGDTVGAFTSIQKSLTLDPDQADLSTLLPELLKSPTSPQLPELAGQRNPFDLAAPAPPNDPLRKVNRPRPSGFDPLVNPGGRPGPK